MFLLTLCHAAQVERVAYDVCELDRHFDFIDRTLTRFRASELTSMGLAAVLLFHTLLTAGGR